MTDLLRQGSQWLEQQRAAHCSSPVTYRRPSAGSGQAAELTVNATYGRTEYEVEDAHGLRVADRMTDFLIAADDLTAVFGEPEVGDKILAEWHAYEVMPLAGQGHWRWSDPHRNTMRIHTKEIGTE